MTNIEAELLLLRSENYCYEDQKTSLFMSSLEEYVVSDIINSTSIVNTVTCFLRPISINIAYCKLMP